MSAEELLPVKEAARRAGIGRSTVYRECREGHFPRPIKVGASTRWVASEVELWVQQQIAASRHRASA
jgi:prophage regulatory protein